MKVLKNGAVFIARRGNHVLAMQSGPRPGDHEFVVWAIDSDGGCCHGNYYYCGESFERLKAAVERLEFRGNPAEEPLPLDVQEV